MTLRPVDLQILMPKTTEVAKVQHTLKENSETQKNILAADFREQSLASKQKVNKRSETEKAKIGDDQNKSKQYYHNAKKGKKQDKERKKDKGKYLKKSSHHIDVRI